MTSPPTTSPPPRVLVVADNAAIAEHALRWADAFALAGTVHRVRLVTTADQRTIESVVAEATNLGAAALVAAGGAAARAVAAAAASRLGLPLAQDDAAGGGHG